MRYGVREICNVVFRAKSDTTIAGKTFVKGQPVLYIDSAKTSTLEGSATTVYATGGRGNTNLIAWEGEKSLTFTVEDALLSPISFSMLSGAGLLKGSESETVHVHTTGTHTITDGKITVDGTVCSTAPIYLLSIETDGSLTGERVEVTEITSTTENGKTTTVITVGTGVDNGTNVFADYYVSTKSSDVDELQIDAENFAGYYYVEADTLFRKQSDGVDAPVNITLPNVKIQSNFTFSMAATGDPSEQMRLAA